MSRAEFFLVAKRLKRFRFVHLLIAPLVAAVMVAVLLFQGYLVSLAGEFTGHLVYPEIPAGFLARVLPGVKPPVVTDAALQLQLSLWTVVTPSGRVEMAAVSNSRLPNWLEPLPGDVWLPASQRDQVYTQQVNDQIALTRFNGKSWITAQARVAGYYQDGGYLSPLLVNPTWAVAWVNQSAESTILAYPEQANKQLQRWVSENPQAELLTQSSIVQSASSMVGSLYSGGYVAVLMGAIFLALGFSVLALLVFLDSRSEIAVFKALGLRPSEVGRLFWAEFGVSTLAGVLIGWGAIGWLHTRFGSLITVNWSVFQVALIVVVGSYGLAMLAPARLARRAQVNELLLRRPILLWSQVVSTPNRQNPGLDDLRARGWSCIKLEMDDDGTPGAVLRPAGSFVRQGETLAWQSTWFGMGERKYVAPHDGILELVDLQRGVLAISPTERNDDSAGEVARDK